MLWGDKAVKLSDNAVLRLRVEHYRPNEVKLIFLGFEDFIMALRWGDNGMAIRTEMRINTTGHARTKRRDDEWWGFCQLVMGVRDSVEFGDVVLMLGNPVGTQFTRTVAKCWVLRGRQASRWGRCWKLDGLALGRPLVYIVDWSWTDGPSGTASWENDLFNVPTMWRWTSGMLILCISGQGLTDVIKGWLNG